MKHHGSAHMFGSENRSAGGVLLSRINVQLLAVVALLVALGLLIVHSAVANDSDYSFSRQAITVCLGFVVMIVITQIDYRPLAAMTTVLLIINVVLILSPLLPFIGQEVNGARSWIRIGMQIQPGEFAKVTVVLLDASVVARYGGRLNNPVEYAKALGVMLVPFVCVMLQPDLGTGLVYLFIAAVALIMGGARARYLIATFIACVVLLLIVLGIDELLKYQDASGDWQYKILKNYQRERFLVFLNPDADTSDSGYNLLQAQIAIGSGGFFGKGLGNSTQASLDFLPEAPTDFIFPVLAEELGFLGVLLLMVLYAALVYVCYRIIKGTADDFGRIIIFCIVGMWLFQILENAGMTLGLMPITGIPLPFVSYGSSFMLVNFIMLGLIGSVWLHGQSAKLS